MFASPKKLSRIGGWDGRRHSSRGELPVLPRLLERPVLLRLGAVLLTALTVTVIAYHCGPTESHRVGQAVPHDLRARVYFEVPDLIQTERLRDEAVEALPPDQRNDPVAVEWARRAVPRAVDRFPPGA